MNTYHSIRDKIAKYSKGILAAGLMAAASLYSSGCASMANNSPSGLPYSAPKHIAIDTPSGSVNVRNPLAEINLVDAMSARELTTTIGSGKKFTINNRGLNPWLYSSSFISTNSTNVISSSTNNLVSKVSTNSIPVDKIGKGYVASTNFVPAKVITTPMCGEHVDYVLRGKDGQIGIPVTNLVYDVDSNVKTTNVAAKVTKKQEVKKVVPVAAVSTNAPVVVSTNAPAYAFDQYAVNSNRMALLSFPLDQKELGEEMARLHINDFKGKEAPEHVYRTDRNGKTVRIHFKTGLDPNLGYRIEAGVAADIGTWRDFTALVRPSRYANPRDQGQVLCWSRGNNWQEDYRIPSKVLAGEVIIIGGTAAVIGGMGGGSGGGSKQETTTTKPASSGKETPSKPGNDTDTNTNPNPAPVDDWGQGNPTSN